MKTLVVEDDFTSRLMLQKIMESYGEVHIAVNGREAVDACRSARAANQPYDLICMDIHLPNMNGQAALKEIRFMEDLNGLTAEQRVRIIMMTASPTEQSVVAAVRDRCDGYLVKPIDRAKLVEKLKECNLVTGE